MMLRQRERPSPLRARRLLRGQRLYDVGAAIGAHQTMISLVERGQRPLTPPLLARLATYYKTPASRLRDEMARWSAARADHVGGPPPGGLAA
jgi:transcriptional regulator with XRE-family HTH domain